MRPDATAPWADEQHALMRCFKGSDPGDLSGWVHFLLTFDVHFVLFSAFRISHNHIQDRVSGHLLWMTDRGPGLQTPGFLAPCGSPLACRQEAGIWRVSTGRPGVLGMTWVWTPQDEDAFLLRREDSIRDSFWLTLDEGVNLGRAWGL